MYLSYLSLTLIAIACFLLGGILTYFSLKQKIKTLKNSLYSLDASLKGMWDANDQWQKKYTALEKNKQQAKNKKTTPSIRAKHASDNNMGLNEIIFS